MDEKELLRVNGRHMRRALGKGLAAKKSAAAASRILAQDEFRRARCILAYHAYGDELCIDDVCQTAHLLKKTICYPITDGHGNMIAATDVLLDEQHERDRYGIVEPRLPFSSIIMPEELDLILVPGVAFDEAGHRLGWGGGYYDRFLPFCKNATFMGIAFDEQIFAHIITDSWDMKMDYVITDEHVYKSSCL